MKREYFLFLVLALILISFVVYLARDSVLFSPATPTDTQGISDNAETEIKDNIQTENENNPQIEQPNENKEEFQEASARPDFSDIRDGYVKVPFHCTGNGNEIELGGEVFMDEGKFGRDSFFDDFYYPRCYGIENCNVAQHTVKLLDEKGEVISLSNYGRVGNAERTFNVDCEKMGQENYYAYVPYLPAMRPISLQLDNGDKICVAGLNPVNDILGGQYYVTDDADFVYYSCYAHWINNPDRKKNFNFRYYELQSFSYETNEEGIWVWLFELENDCRNWNFKTEFNIMDKYERDKIYGPNTLLSVTHPFYGDANTGEKGGGRYCNGLWTVIT